MNRQKRQRGRKGRLLLGVLVLSLISYIFYTGVVKSDDTSDIATPNTVQKKDEVEKIADIPHMLTPSEVKGVYITSWVMGTPSLHKHVIDLIDQTEANSIIIDIKDYTGKVSFKTGDASIDDSGCMEERIHNIEDQLKDLHERGIYVIGRVAVFQDPCFVQKHPEVAVKRQSDGAIWKDRKGISWVDMGSKEAWDNAVHIAKVAYGLGFDEINFDYVRFPSDGDMKNISFISGNKPKSEVFKEFFMYLDKELRGGRGTLDLVQVDSSPSADSITSSVAPTSTTPLLRATDKAFDEHFELTTSTSTKAEKQRATLARTKVGEGRPIISADLFGMVTTQKDDLGIGQLLEHALPFVDYIGPMVYPSHYPPTWNGYKNPAEHPYEVIKISMGEAVKRTETLGLNRQKLRPWLQDFDLGATYTAEMVRAQMKATYDVGLTSWMMWDASNKYTRSAFLNTTSNN
jgi:hypothetical protein